MEAQLWQWACILKPETRLASALKTSGTFLWCETKGSRGRDETVQQFPPSTRDKRHFLIFFALSSLILTSHLASAQVEDLELGGVRYHGIFDDDMGPVVRVVYGLYGLPCLACMYLSSLISQRCNSKQDGAKLSP